MMFSNGAESVGKTLMFFGIVLFIVGVLLYLGSKYTVLGRLPGDINIERDHFSFHFPVATSIVISLVLTVLVNLFISRK